MGIRQLAARWVTGDLGLTFPVPLSQIPALGGPKRGAGRRGSGPAHRHTCGYPRLAQAPRRTRGPHPGLLASWDGGVPTLPGSCGLGEGSVGPAVSGGSHPDT